MWPFKKKTLEVDPRIEAIAALKAFGGIGHQFNYLGRVCVVTGHYDFLPWYGIVPMLKFDYADNSGVLHSMSARVSELPALIGHLKPNVEHDRRPAALSPVVRVDGPVGPHTPEN